jgi:HEAT repeat protein
LQQRPTEKTGVEQPSMMRLWGREPLTRAAIPSLFAPLRSDDRRLRAAAAHAFGELGVEGRIAVRRLREMQRTDADPKVRRLAQETFELAEVLTSNSNVRVRYLAAAALDHIGPPAGAVRWALEAALTDPNPAVSGIAELALSSIRAS